MAVRAGCCCSTYFYPRPPRGGRRFSLSSNGTVNLFLSTPSARRATSSTGTTTPDSTISIHALREEGDLLTNPLPYGNDLFLSTPSARRATWRDEPATGNLSISIHALREEGDR